MTVRLLNSFINFVKFSSWVLRRRVISVLNLVVVLVVDGVCIFPLYCFSVFSRNFESSEWYLKISLKGFVNYMEL